VVAADCTVLCVTNDQQSNERKGHSGPSKKKKREPVVWMKDYGEKLSFASSLHN
jgi:hypothetical protein